MPDAEPTAERVARPPSAAVSDPPRAAVFSFWRLALRWTPPLLWMAMILIASSDWLGSPVTESWLRQILAAIFGPIPGARFDLIHLLARKTGHLVSYAVLAALSYRSARVTLSASPVWSRRAGVCALLLSLATASLDETHQAFTQTRTGSAYDVVLDMAGTLVALTMIWIAARRRKKSAG